MQRPGIKRKGKKRPTGLSLGDMKRTAGLFFLDSGAHSLYTREVISKHHKQGYSYYKSKDFWKYVDRYANFIKDNEDGIDYYANVDVIFNPEITFQVQCYLEDQHGLLPVPVVHYGTDLKWIDRYLTRKDYPLMGIGGLGQEAQRNDYLKWADGLYDHICNNPRRLPCVRTHGFAMTSYTLMTRYPWWSVDSVAWAKAAGVGNLFVPHKRRGVFVFDEHPYIIGLSHESKSTEKNGRHFYSLSDLEKNIIMEWLAKINMPFGSVNWRGKTLEYGVVSEYNARAWANLKFFEALCDFLPKWPWSFQSKPTQEGFFS